MIFEKRSRSVSIAISAVVVAALIGVGSTSVVNASNADYIHVQAALARESNDPMASMQDGEALFRGIFFLQGEVGSRLSDLSSFRGVPENIEENNTPESIEVIDSVINKMTEAEPQFFNRFSEEARSGDPVRVGRIVVDAERLVRSAAPEFVAPQENSVDARPTCGVTVVVGAAVVHAAGVFTAVGLAVAEAAAVGHFVVYGQVYFWPSSQTTSTLAEEQQLAELMTALKTV